MGAELRKYRRVPFAFPVKIYSYLGETVGSCQRVATIGLFIYTSAPFTGGLPVELEFTLPFAYTETISAKAKVQRIQGEDPVTKTLGGILVLFTQLSPEDEQGVQSFVERCIRQGEEYDRAELDSRGTGGGPTIPVRFYGTDAPGNQFVDNISRGGVFIRSMEPLQKGLPLRLALYLPGIKIPVVAEATVAWSLPHQEATAERTGMGIEFTRITDEALAAIDEFVDQYSQD